MWLISLIRFSPPTYFRILRLDILRSNCKALVLSELITTLFK